MRRPAVVPFLATMLAMLAHANDRRTMASAFSHAHNRAVVVRPLQTTICDEDVVDRRTLPTVPWRNRNGNVDRARSVRVASKRRAKGASSDEDVAEETAPGDVSEYYDRLLSQFRGDFDNYDQVIRDREHGLLPGAGGGHEHIHCTLVPCPRRDDNDDDEALMVDRSQNRSQWVIAAFYFNGNPRQIFRFRAYRLIPPEACRPPRIRMKLHTLSPDLERRLRQRSEEPCSWWEEAGKAWRELDEEEEGARRDEERSGEEWEDFQTTGMAAMVSPLDGCDVLWDPNWDPSKHSYLYSNEYDDSPPPPPAPEATSTKPRAPLPPGPSCHATMEAGSKGAIVDSISLVPGKRILIKDELSLWEDEFWINDRGYDPDEVSEGGSDDGEGGMPFVYGNRRGVPYKLRKVADLVLAKNEGGKDDAGSGGLPLERAIVDPDLEWTLGEHFRTSDVYQEKMQAVEDAME